MNKFIFTILIFFMPLIILGQIKYESPLGFSAKFDNTWKKLPREVVSERFSQAKQLLDYKKDISYDACYQKIGNSNMDYPYILFKNIFVQAQNDDDIQSLINSINREKGIKEAIKSIENGKISLDYSTESSYYDKQKKIFVLIFNMGVSIKGDLIGMMAFYFGKNATLQIMGYSYKDEFKYDKDEFTKIIYSIEEKNMQSTLDEYSNKHEIATRYYNEGVMKSQAGDKFGALEQYTLAINNYPLEDKISKSEAYYNCGVIRRGMNDNKAAIKDYSAAILLRPDYYKAYNNRGFAKLQIDDFKGAINDFTLTIKYDNYQTEFSQMALGNRGIAKFSINQDGCPDLKKAIDAGNTKVLQVFSQYCK